MVSQDKSYFVILSGNYCTPEIAAEFGKLPPAFIPLGAGRLFHRQLDMARACGATPVLSIPSDYVLSPWDERDLARAQVRVVRAPQSLTLNEAVQFVLEVLDARGALYMLYGDTLVEGDRLTELDQAAVHKTRSHYNWAEASMDLDGKLKIRSGYGDGVTERSVLSGYFSFSNAAVLRQACVSGDSFDQSLEAYARLRDLRPVEVKDWHDFGHLSLIYQSRRNVMVSRSFNRVWSDGVSVIKSSENTGKIAAEAAWYTSIPDGLRLYTPHFLGQDKDLGNYRLEYLYLPTLAELYTFGELPGFVWRQILDNCMEFLRECWSHRPAPDSPEASPEFAAQFFDNMFRRKTHERVEAFRKARGWESGSPLAIDGRVMPSLETVCDRLLSYITPTGPDHIRVWHGDFFFGNTLYDFRAARVKVIDPRGGDSEETTSIYGDYRYDLAKLAHSIIGGYDALLSGCVDFDRRSEHSFHFNRRWTQTQEEIAEIFKSLTVDGLPVCTDEIIAMTALLFLTMLPLHADDPQRQDIMLCNGLTLAQDLFTKREA